MSLLYYDYVHWYVKALGRGRLDDPDAVVATLEKMKYQGVVSEVPLYLRQASPGDVRDRGLPGQAEHLGPVRVRRRAAAGRAAAGDTGG